MEEGRKELERPSKPQSNQKNTLTVKNQVRTRKLTHARSPIVCVRYVRDYEVVKRLRDHGFDF